MCQRCLRLGEPPGHRYGAIHLAGCGQGCPGLLSLAGRGVESAKTQVAMCLEWAHTQGLRACAWPIHCYAILLVYFSIHPSARGAYDRGEGMVKSASTKLVREMMGGESYEYYPLGQYIVAAPGVCGGRPTFKYTRIDVHHALGLLAVGRTVEQVAHSYDLPVEAVQEALKLAARALDRQGGRLIRRT
jgi:uncharacterized protein (DUF433 family)